MTTIKIRLKAGDREIEIEGARSDVDELLAAWWKSAPALENDSKTFVAKNNHGASEERLSVDTQSNESSFDPNQLVNQIKQLENFATIERKIILARGEHYQKIALILWVSGVALTSGQIHRALEALSIRIALPHVSTSLKRNMGKFLTSTQRRAGGPPPTYRLTAHAKVEFEHWLDSNEQ